MSERSFKRARARRQDRERRRLATLQRRGKLLAGAALGATALLTSSAEATTFTVTTNADTNTGCVGTNCPSLRDAINAHNALTSNDTIAFAPGVTGTIPLGSDLPTILSTTGGLTISGPGAAALTINGNGHQLFNLHATTGAGVAEEIDGLTLTNGNHGAAFPGGAVDVETQDLPLTLTGDVISNSTTSNSNGGGGIASAGPLTISGTTIAGNSAPAGNGGGIAMTHPEPLTITNSTISGNTALRGGGVEDRGDKDLVITGSQITNNQSTAPSAGGEGGGIYAETNALKISGSTITGNTSTGHGGGLFGGGKYAGTSITNSTISGNTAVTGGGIDIVGGSLKYTLIENSTVSGNQATRGAGIALTAIEFGGGLKIEATTISGNTGGPGSFGGGLDIQGPVNAPVKLVDSTISGNSAANGGGVSVGDDHNYPQIVSLYGGHGSIAFNNSTIAGNAAATAGGGIYLGEYTLPPSTVEQSSTPTITSTIVSGNGGQDLARATGSTTGGFVGAFSLIQNPGSAPLTKQAVITGVDPKLGALASNGGPTKTMLPAGNSPVIDQGHAPRSLTTDQIGNPRTVDTAIANASGGDGTDIGAVELPAASVIVPPAPTAGFTAAVRGTNLGGSARPLIVGNTTPVICSVTTGGLASCVIEVRFRGKLLGSGAVTGTSTSKRLTTAITPTKAGLNLFTSNPLGVDATATATGSALGSPTLTGNVHFLPGPTITLPIPGRTPTLTRQLQGQLDQIARLLTGERSVTCTAYTNQTHGKKGRKNDLALTTAQAKAACNRLIKHGLKTRIRFAGKGGTNPIATNKTPRGRAANRRLVITFTL